MKPSMLLLAGLLTWPLATTSQGAATFVPLRCGPTTCVFKTVRAPGPLEALTVQLSPGLFAAGPADGWRLVRTPGPDNTDVVSIMRTADFMQSDPEFAGLMIRCRQKSGLQIAFAVITPFHPRARPNVTVAVNRSDIHFQAEVIPPGGLVALPSEAEVLAKGVWQSAKELSVTIEGEGARIHGVVSLENLSGAIAQLQSSCP